MTDAQIGEARMGNSEGSSAILRDVPVLTVESGPRTPVITHIDLTRVSAYLSIGDFQPSSRALSAPHEAQHADWHGGTLGAEQAAFAQEFTEVHGKGSHRFFSVPVSNGTRAISLALTAVAAHADRLGLRKPEFGDNVIVPALTWPATATAALERGFVPRLADVEASTLCMDPLSVRELINPRTFAIIAVHLYNRMPNLSALAAIAEEYHLALIEDCAHAHGAEYDSRPAGTIGHAGTFSLQASKTLTCGEGGVVTTRDRQLAEQIASMANCGRPCGEAIALPSGNDRLPGLSAALARSQLTKFEPQQAARSAMWARLDESAAHLVGVEPLPPQSRTLSPTYKWAARYHLEDWGGMSLDQVAAALSAELDVEVSRTYEPLNVSPLYRPLNDPLTSSTHAVDQLDPAQYRCPAAAELYKSVLVIEHAAALRRDFSDLYAAAVLRVRRRAQSSTQPERELSPSDVQHHHRSGVHHG